MISKDKWAQLQKRLDELGVKENDLQESFVIGSGRGGQKLHKTANCVHLKHLPSGTAVKCQETRSLSKNRFYARRRLCDKLEAQQKDKKSKAQQQVEKIRRQKKRRSRRAKQKILSDKHHQSALKKSRQKPKPDNE